MKRISMLRYIFLFILFFLLYRLVKALFSSSTKRNIEIVPPGKGPGEDEMVQDPSCGMYIVKEDAYPVKIKGESLYFCSKECLEKYKKEKN